MYEVHLTPSPAPSSEAGPDSVSGPVGGDETRVAAFESASPGLVAVDPDGRVVIVNGAARRLFSLPADDRTGTRDWSWFRSQLVTEAGAELPASADPVDQALRSGTEGGDRIVGRRGGDQAITWMILSARAIPGRRGVVASFCDHPFVTDSSRQSRFYAVRSAVSRSIARSASRDDLLESACRAALVGGHLKMAWIGSVDPDGRIRPGARAGDEQGYLDAIELTTAGAGRHSLGPSGRAVGENHPVAVRDIATDPAMEPWRQAALARGYRSSAALPLTRLGQPCGVFCVYSGEVGAFDDDELQLLAGVAEDISFGLEAYEAARAKADAEDRYRTIVETAHEGIWTIDAEARTTFVNGSLAAMLGLPREELIGRSLFDFLPEADHDRAREGLARRQRGIAESREVVVRRPDGTLVRTTMSGTPLFDEHGAYQGSLAMVSDITSRTRAERELRVSEERWRAMVQHSSDIICVLNPDGSIRYVSPAVKTILGYDPQSLHGTSGLDLVAEADRPAVGALLAQAVAGRDVASGPLEIRMVDRSGAERWLSLTGTNLLHTEAVAGLVLNARDVTDRRMFEAQLEHQALHDPLTDLPNRALLFDRLEQALARTRRTGTQVGVLFLDVDQFKLINDSRGHPAGDEALARVASLISESVRPSDTVARFGGDEFVVLVEGVNTEEEVMATAERIRLAVEGPLDLASGPLHVTVSIGVVLSDHRGGADLLSSADAAMYRAKELGRNRAALFAAEMREKAADRLDLEADLRTALSTGGQLAVHYQPVVDLSAWRIIGFEALLRWQHPQRGPVSPEQFIPIAEDTGLIGPLGDWVMAEATRQLAVWSDRYGRPDLHMAINLSPRQLTDSDLVPNVAGHVARAGVDPNAVILEITETALMDDVEAAAEVLDQLKKTRMRVAIDDFGTGYSSLGHLKRLPVDMLKIDRAFVSGLGIDDHARAIPASIVMLAESLNLEVVAEGVEQLPQLRQLQRMGCRLVQGFLFSPALPAGRLEDRFPGLALPAQPSPAGAGLPA